MRCVLISCKSELMGLSYDQKTEKVNDNKSNDYFNVSIWESNTISNIYRLLARYLGAPGRQTLCFKGSGASELRVLKRVRSHGNSR